jgi:RecJ-like exonuclease
MVAVPYLASSASSPKTPVTPYLTGLRFGDLSSKKTKKSEPTCSLPAHTDDDESISKQLMIYPEEVEMQDETSHNEQNEVAICDDCHGEGKILEVVQCWKCKGTGKEPRAKVQ